MPLNLTSLSENRPEDSKDLADRRLTLEEIVTEKNSILIADYADVGARKAARTITQKRKNQFLNKRKLLSASSVPSA